MAAPNPAKGARSKRVFDIAAALALLVILAPALLLIACVVLSDGGSILYAHPRVGRRGRIFKCLKFRSMHMNSAELLDSLLKENPELRSEWESSRKLRWDPRVTRVGRVLRKTSLDELPQLINVLKGDMSLVGPRPVVPEELRKYYNAAAASMYLSVRPGLTGLWQVSGRSDVSYPDRVALDCAYIANMSITNDVGLLFRTIGVLVRRIGAY